MHTRSSRANVVQLDAYRKRQDSAARAGPAPGEFISFRLGTEEYGIDIKDVQEVLPWRGGTPLAGVPHFVRGLIDVGGTAVTVIDLRRVFALERSAHDPYAAVIVMALPQGRVGVVVDAVKDVLALAAPQIKPPPPAIGTGDTGLITGIGRLQARSLMLMDIGALMRNLGMDRVDNGRH